MYIKISQTWSFEKVQVLKFKKMVYLKKNSTLFLISS